MAFTLIRPRSTGRWDITGRLSGLKSGQLHVEREGGTVWLNFQVLVVDEPGTFVIWDSALPPGLRPPAGYVDLPLQGRASTDTAGPARIASHGQITVYKPVGTIRGLISFRTEEPMITTVPGGVKL